MCKSGLHARRSQLAKRLRHPSSPTIPACVGRPRNSGILFSCSCILCDSRQHPSLLDLCDRRLHLRLLGLCDRRQHHLLRILHLLRLNRLGSELNSCIGVAI
ncbi:hypothetical protein LXL04_034129 [Taraxacum kok-saghyz]